MRKAELVALLQNSPPPSQSRASTSPTPHTRPPPPPQMSTWERIDDRRPRKPSPQEMDIFEQQEISKSRPQVKTKLNKWYDWLINHVPKPIKDGASKAFKTFKDKVMGLYNSSTGNETIIKESRPFKPIELEQAFGGAYRSYRINGRPKIDVDTFFNRIGKRQIELIDRELKTRTSARIQTTAWIRFFRDDEEGQERVELAFNSLMTSVYRGPEMDQIVDGMTTNNEVSNREPSTTK